jgi:hypothetical protein
VPEKTLPKYLQHILIIQYKMRRAFWGIMFGLNNWSAREKVTKIPPKDNVNRRYFLINCLKKKILNIKMEKQLKNLKISRSPC